MSDAQLESAISELQENAARYARSLARVYGSSPAAMARRLRPDMATGQDDEIFAGLGADAADEVERYMATMLGDFDERLAEINRQLDRVLAVGPRT
jgi:hypothetical protein